MATNPNPVGEVLAMGAAATRMEVGFRPPTMSWTKKWRCVSFCLPSRSDVGGKLVENVWDFPATKRETRTTKRMVAVEIGLLAMVAFEIEM